MSDDLGDGTSFTEGSEPIEKVKRGGGGAKAILGLLKWIGIGLGAVIFIVVIVVVTVNVLNKQSKPLSTIPTGEDYQQATPIYATFTAIEQVTTSTMDAEPWSVIVKINLAYDPEDKDVQTELTGRKYQILDALRNFFSRKYIDELKPERERVLKEEIRAMLNRMLTKPSLKDVYFETFKYTPM